MILKIVMDKNLNYLLYCGKMFTMSLMSDGRKVFCHHPNLPDRDRDYRYLLTEKENQDILSCSYSDAIKLTVMLNNYCFPDSKQMNAELDGCKDYPESRINLYGE